MLMVGPKLEGAYFASEAEPCPFCASHMERYRSDATGTIYHPLGRECILDGKGVLADDIGKWNTRYSEYGE